jgi:hypothetical protein
LGVTIALLFAAACGKKGPPLAPLIPIPAAVGQISATRVGDEVYVTLTVPSANIDTFGPADLDRIEVFGYTGRTPPPRTRWVEFGTLIATVPVAPPPPPAPPPGQPPTEQASPSEPTPVPAVRAPQQGAPITIVDTLTADELVQGKVPAPEPGTQKIEPGTPNLDPRTANVEPGTGLPNQNLDPGTPKPEPVLRRFYTAFPFSPRGRPGPPGSNAELPLMPVPAPPPAVTVRYTEDAVSVMWEPSGGLIGYLLERTLPEEELPLELEDLVGPLEPSAPPGPVSYNVYRAVHPDPFAPPPEAPVDAAWTSRPPTPLNPLPLTAFEFGDTVAFHEERCYTVRAVRGVGPAARVGEASPPACVTLVDTFAPEAPAGLATVASEGAINLIWEPNTEADLAGYVVLRGEASSDTLQPVTDAPIVEARYRDTAVTPGVRYVYAVVAIDNRFPVPNLSAASETQEETAR